VTALIESPRVCSPKIPTCWPGQCIRETVVWQGEPVKSML
jgi:hypothetical protein